MSMSSRGGSSSGVSFTLPTDIRNPSFVPRQRANGDEIMWEVLTGALFALNLDDSQIGEVKRCVSAFIQENKSKMGSKVLDLGQPSVLALASEKKAGSIVRHVAGANLKQQPKEVTSINAVGRKDSGRPKSEEFPPGVLISPRGGDSQGQPGSCIVSPPAATMEKVWLPAKEKEITVMKNVGKISELYLREQAMLKSVILAQSRVRGYLARKRYKKLAALYAGTPLGKRNEGIRELIKTERMFISHLSLLVNEYMIPLQEKAKNKKTVVLPKEDIDSIFSNVDEILAVHQSLLSDLVHVLEKWPRCHGIGKAFKRRAQDFKAYSNYVNNFKHAQNTLNTCTDNNPKFRAFQDETYARTEMYCLALHELLGVPLNRISQYTALLGSLVANSPGNTRDKRRLEDAYAIMQQMYLAVSAAIENADMRATILAIQKRIGHPDLQLVHTKRRFIGEGRLQMRTDRSSTKKRKRDLFLFNDILLITKLKGKFYKVYSQINLYMSALHDDDGQKKKKDKEVFSLETLEGHFEFFAKDRPDKQLWLQRFSETEIRRDSLRIFGRPLQEVLDNEKSLSKIPKLIEKCCSYLIAKGLTTEGLFRVAADAMVVNPLKEKMDTSIDDVNLDKWEDIHAIAGLLKTYLRAMPEPLMTFDFYDKIVASYKIFSDDLEDDEEKLLEAVMPHIQMIPASCRHILAYLIKFLCEVANHADANLMDAYNLSIVFGPSLLHPREDTIESSLKSPRANLLIQAMINHYDKVFS